MRFIFSVLRTFSSKNSSYQSGFILLEMTIALIILGIIGTISFPLITKYIEYSKWQKTEKHQEEVLQSLKTYLFMHHSLPCPADPSKPGIAKTICQNPLESVGIIPYRTLSLPLLSVKDGFNHFMTYTVNPYLTQSQGQEFCQDKKPVIQVLFKNKDKNESVFELENSRPDFGETVSDVIAFVIISYGPKGIGSFDTEEAIIAQNLSQSMSLEEKQNTNPTSKHVSLTAQSNNTPPLTFFTQNYSTNLNQLFRHKIIWRTQKFFAGFCQKKKLQQNIPSSLRDDKQTAVDNIPGSKLPAQKHAQDSAEHGQQTSPEHRQNPIENDHGINNFIKRRSAQPARNTTS